MKAELTELLCRAERDENAFHEALKASFESAKEQTWPDNNKDLDMARFNPLAHDDGTLGSYMSGALRETSNTLRPARSPE